MLSPKTANRITRAVRRLLTAGLITPHDYACFDALFWRCRRLGAWEADPDYRTIARLAGVCRDRAIKAVHRLEALGVLTKRRRHVLISWGRNRAHVAARQVANLYTFCVCASKESSGPAAIGGEAISLPLEQALAGLGAAMARGSGPATVPTG